MMRLGAGSSIKDETDVNRDYQEKAIGFPASKVL